MFFNPYHDYVGDKNMTAWFTMTMWFLSILLHTHTHTCINLLGACGHTHTHYIYPCFPIRTQAFQNLIIVLKKTCYSVTATPLEHSFSHDTQNAHLHTDWQKDSIWKLLNPGMMINIFPINDIISCKRILWNCNKSFLLHAFMLLISINKNIIFFLHVTTISWARW